MKTARLAVLGIAAATALIGQTEARPGQNAPKPKMVLNEPMPVIPSSHVSTALAPVRQEAFTRRSATDGSFSTFQVWYGLTIPAGQTLNMASDQDWTGTTGVAIAIECP